MTTTYSDLEDTTSICSITTNADVNADAKCRISTDRVRQTKVDSMLDASLRDSVAFRIGFSVPEVQAVFTKLEEKNVLHVWAIVSENDRRVYRSVYAKEKEIIGMYGGVDFDFNVVPSHGRDPQGLISDPGIELAFLRK